MQAGEYGKTLVINCGFDLTGWTSISLSIVDPDGIELGPHAIAAIGTVNLTVDGVVYLAGQYVEYVTVATEFVKAGLHRLKLTVNFGAAKRLRSVTADFVVKP